MIDSTALYEDLQTAGLPVISANSDGRVDYSRDLTPAEQTTAQAIIAAHDQAIIAAHDPAKRERDERTARDVAKAAATDLRTYLDRTNPTQAQTVAALKLLIRVVLWLLRNEFRT